MKLSNRIMKKLLLIIVILGLLAGGRFAFIVKQYNEKNYEYYSSQRIVDLLISEEYRPFKHYRYWYHDNPNDSEEVKRSERPKAIHYMNELYNQGYDINGNGEIEDEEFYQKIQDYYKSYAKNFHNNSIISTIAMVILSIIAIIIFIATVLYFIKTNKLIKKIKKYLNYMLVMGKYNIEDISKEFGENIEIVEANIQKAIDKHILKNVYLSKQTKEILLIDNVSANKKVKGNIQNVNVENNVIISEKGEEKNE